MVNEWGHCLVNNISKNISKVQAGSSVGSGRFSKWKHPKEPCFLLISNPASIFSESLYRTSRSWNILLQPKQPTTMNPWKTVAGFTQTWKYVNLYLESWLLHSRFIKWALPQNLHPPLPLLPSPFPLKPFSVLLTIFILLSNLSPLLNWNWPH